MSKLAVWWLRLGIDIERIKPGHPQQNGRHERIHLTLKKEATKPAAQNMQQQARFDDFLDCYNCERPHEALGMQVPVQRYRPSEVAYSAALRPIEYPDTDCVVTVGWNGFMHFQGHRLHVSSALQGLPIGIRQSPGCDGVHDVYFCHQRFAQFDLREPAVDT